MSLVTIICDGSKKTKLTEEETSIHRTTIKFYVSCLYHLKSQKNNSNCVIYFLSTFPLCRTTYNFTCFLNNFLTATPNCVDLEQLIIYFEDTFNYTVSLSFFHIFKIYIQQNKFCHLSTNVGTF